MALVAVFNARQRIELWANTISPEVITRKIKRLGSAAPRSDRRYLMAWPSAVTERLTLRVGGETVTLRLVTH